MELWYTEKHSPGVNLSFKVKEHLFSEKSDFQKVDVIDTFEYGKVLLIDGLVMITDKDEFIYHDMICHVPMAVNPDIKKVLVIGGGDGGTVRELTRYDYVEKIDMVEIDKVVVDAAVRFFPQVSCGLSDERVNLMIDDGIRYVRETEEKYDLILVDSTDPIGPGEGLFSLDFYRNCHRILTDKGIIVNQNESPFFADTAREMVRAHQKLKEIFPIAMPYQYSIPTYPSGYWFFGYASKKLNPVTDCRLDEWEKIGLKTRYYNTDIHKAVFALPTFVREMLADG